MKATKARSGPESNTRIQAERRRQLIEATLTSIAEVGLPNVTLAKVAGYAGLTAAMVNFHFSSKDSLMLETLRFVSSEFRTRFEAAVEKAGGDPVRALNNIIDTQFDPELSDNRRLAVWYSFWSERRSRADYQEICGALDRAYERDITVQFRQLVEVEGRQEMDPEALAMAFMGMIDFLWQGLMVDEAPGARKQRAAQCRSYLESIFPSSFARGRKPGKAAAAPSPAIAPARSRKWHCVGHLDDLAEGPLEDADVDGIAVRVRQTGPGLVAAARLLPGGAEEADTPLQVKLVDGLIFLRS